MAGIIVDWNVFNYKFSGRQREMFESLAYTLFCFEFKQKFGIFRYFNQPYIETQPIKTDDGDVVGFQAKYYDAATRLSSKKKEIIEAIDGAKAKYAGINRYIIYTNKELSASKDKGKVKPDYQVEIEDHGKKSGIQIEWRVKSNFEFMLHDPRLSAVKELYFSPNTDLKRFAENIHKRTCSILDGIRSDIVFNDNNIKIEYTQKEILDFSKSDKNAFVVYGIAGTGKSGYVKDFCERIGKEQDLCLLVFSASDFDVKEETELLSQFGKYGLDDLISLYDEDDNKYCVIESAEKYNNFSNYDVFRKAVHRMIETGWKIIFTIRTQYKNGFVNAILDGISISEFSIDSIDESKLRSLSENHGFELPGNKKLYSFLCNLFYLKLYLELLSIGVAIPSDAKTFTDQIWKQVIRNDKQRQGNLPVKREAFIINMASSLLDNDRYVYEADASDDAEVISLLEEQGIIAPYNDEPVLWVFNHDVYEEIVVNHIFDSKYKNSSDMRQITETFNGSLRSRKMYRIWLETKLRDMDSGLFSALTNALSDSEFSQLWKDETIIALMNSDNDEAFQLMDSTFAANNYALFTRTVFLLNTACKRIRRTEFYTKLAHTHNISAYRFTEPTGKAWRAVFSYISKHIDLIPWNKLNLSFVTQAMDSWVKSNVTGETTRIVGHIALSLKDKVWQEREKKSGLYDDTMYKSINKIILFAANEIKDELVKLIDGIINNGSFRIRDKEYVFLTQSLSNIYDCGKICEALPEKTLQLAWAYWHHKDDENIYYSPELLESSFGLNDRLHSEYYPTSAYQTPIWALLRKNPEKTIDFIIDLTNNAAKSYEESELNKNYNECYEIKLVLSEKEVVSQICSDRLWKIHRGTGVAPHLLESALMALEDYVLSYVEQLTKEDAVALCYHLLENSNNAAITAVVMSAVIAFPDKLLEISCILLKTKELFVLDRSRFINEREANMFRGLNKRFDDERRLSNDKQFRKKKFEDIILNYQVNSGGLPEGDFKQRLDKLYSAIDSASTDIDKWHPSYQACFYRMDWRKYKQAGEPVINGKQISIPMQADFPQQVADYAKESEEASAKALGNMELLLWASSRYKGGKQYKDHCKYDDDPSFALEEIISLAESDEENVPLLSDDTASYTIAVLLRDFSSALDSAQYDYCKEAISGLGYEILRKGSRFSGIDAKNAIITEISRLVDMSNNSFNRTDPAVILLAFMLDYRRQTGNNMIDPLAALWDRNREAACKLIVVFSKLAPLFDGKNIIKFVESNQTQIAELMSADNYSLESIDITALDHNSKVYIAAILDRHDTGIFDFVVSIGKEFWAKLFSDDYDDSINKNFVLESEYKKWLAEYLLFITDDERSKLVQTLMPLVRFDRSFNRLLSDIISAENANPRYEAFWNLWTLLQDYIFSRYEKNNDYYKNAENDIRIGLGYEDVLSIYLLANPHWREGITQWHSLKVNNSSFYLAAANRTGYDPTTLFSVSYVLNTVGKTPFKAAGLDMLHIIIKNNHHLYQRSLIDNTLFYIEEYILSFVTEQTELLQADASVKKKVVDVLDFLVARGSTMGYLLREEMI